MFNGKIETHFARVTVDIIDDKPYYSILYFDPRDGEHHMGFGSYKFENTFEWLRENFEINCGGNDDPTFRVKEELKIRCAEFKEVRQLCEKRREENSNLETKYEKLFLEFQQREAIPSYPSLCYHGHHPQKIQLWT